MDCTKKNTLSDRVLICRRAPAEWKEGTERVHAANLARVEALARVDEAETKVVTAQVGVSPSAG